MNALKIGVTGGIGSGKTTVCKVFSSFGIPIYDSDINAKKIINSDQSVINIYKKYFGEDIYESGTLNTKKVAKIIFSDEKILREVEKYVHKAVRNDFNNWATKQNSKIVINEAAIMFESGSYKNMDKIITVSAPEEVRIERVMKRNSITKEEVIRRIKLQLDDAEKIKLSDFVIYADDEMLVVPQVLKILKKLEEYFA